MEGGGWSHSPWARRGGPRLRRARPSLGSSRATNIKPVRSVSVALYWGSQGSPSSGGPPAELINCFAEHAPGLFVS